MSLAKWIRAKIADRSRQEKTEIDPEHDFNRDRDRD